MSIKNLSKVIDITFRYCYDWPRAQTNLRDKCLCNGYKKGFGRHIVFLELWGVFGGRLSFEKTLAGEE